MTEIYEAKRLESMRGRKESFCGNEWNRRTKKWKQQEKNVYGF